MLLLVRMCCLWYRELCSEIRSVVGGTWSAGQGQPLLSRTEIPSWLMTAEETAASVT